VRRSDARGWPQLGSADVARTGLKGKGLKLLHCYTDQLWALGDKSAPDAGFTPQRIFPQVPCACRARALPATGAQARVRACLPDCFVCVRVSRRAARRADWRLAWHRLRRASRAPGRAQARPLRHLTRPMAVPPPVRQRAARRRAAPPARRRRSTGRGRPTRAPLGAARQAPRQAPTPPPTATRARHRATRAAARQVPARLLALVVQALSNAGQRSVSKVGRRPQRSLAGCGAGALQPGRRADAAVRRRGGGRARGGRSRGRRATAAAGEPGRAAALLPARGAAPRAARRSAVPDLRLLLQVHAARKARRSRPRGCRPSTCLSCNQTRPCWAACLRVKCMLKAATAHTRQDGKRRPFGRR